MKTREELYRIILDWQESIEDREKSCIRVLQSDRFKLADMILCEKVVPVGKNPRSC